MAVGIVCSLKVQEVPLLLFLCRRVGGWVPAPRMLLCRHAAVYSTDPESVMGECSVRYDSERIR